MDIPSDDRRSGDPLQELGLEKPFEDFSVLSKTRPDIEQSIRSWFPLCSEIECAGQVDPEHLTSKNHKLNHPGTTPWVSRPPSIPPVEITDGIGYLLL